MGIILFFHYQLGNWNPEELSNEPKATQEGQGQNSIAGLPCSKATTYPFWNKVT